VLASSLPLIFINHISATYVTRLCIYLPTLKKSNKLTLNNTDVFDPYKLDKSGNPILYFETLGFFGNRVKTLTRLNELIDVSKNHKFKYITWMVKNKNGSSNRNYQTQFYIEKHLLRSDLFTNGLVQWIEKKSSLLSNNDDNAKGISNKHSKHVN
jgi:hypothetical protein